MTTAATETLRHWLLSDGLRFSASADFVEAFCVRLQAAVPVSRAIFAIRTIHPQIVAHVYRWTSGDGEAEGPSAEVSEIERLQRDITTEPDYLESPIKRIHDGAGELRRRLTGDPAADDFPLMGQLRDQGYSDYVIFAIEFSDGVRNSGSFATRAPGGYTDHQLAFLREIMPLVSLILEVRATRQIAVALLDTYVGHEAGERILNGQVVRGEGQHVHAVIWYADLRDFTRLSDTRPMEEVIGILDDWFEALTRAIHNHGGQVLKFIGDGLLAIFPLGDAAFRHYTCRQALQAAIEAQAAVAELNTRRAAEGAPVLSYRLALHVGDLMWGNIGAADRLDFTAIGPSVNLTARLEALCAELGVRIVLSRDFAATASESHALVSLGEHYLRGVTEPQEVFTLAAEAAEAAEAAGAGARDRGRPA